MGENHRALGAATTQSVATRLLTYEVLTQMGGVKPGRKLRDAVRFAYEHGLDMDWARRAYRSRGVRRG